MEVIYPCSYPSLPIAGNFFPSASSSGGFFASLNVSPFVFYFASVHRPCHGMGMVWFSRTLLQPHWEASPQPGQHGGSKGRQDHSTEGLPGGTVLSLQACLLRSIFTSFPPPYREVQTVSWQAGSWPHLALVQELRGGVTASPSPWEMLEDKHWSYSLHTPPSAEDSDKDSRLLFNLRLWSLARRVGGIPTASVWPCNLMGGCCEQDAPNSLCPCTAAAP